MYNIGETYEIPCVFSKYYDRFMPVHREDNNYYWVDDRFLENNYFTLNIKTIDKKDVIGDVSWQIFQCYR